MNKSERLRSKPPKPQQHLQTETRVFVNTGESALRPMQNEIINETPEDSDKRISEKMLDQLHDALDARSIKNSEGVDVKLRVAREKFSKTGEEIWYITFEYEQKGRLINHKYPYTNDYIKLSVTPTTRTIAVGMAQLETRLLKGKNVYPQVIQLISENFPNNFDLEAEFGHDQTKNEVLKAKNEYDQGLIDIEKFKQRVLQSYLFRVRIAGGFNQFNLVFLTNSGGEVDLKVKAKKNELLHQPELTIELS